MSPLPTIAVPGAPAEPIEPSSAARSDDSDRTHLAEESARSRFLDVAEPGDRPKLRARRRLVRSARKKRLRNVSLD